MAFNEQLGDRIRHLLKRRKGIEEKKMFGGLAFMVNGNMACGIVGDRLCLRLGEEGATAALEEPNVIPMDFTGKPMKTMVYVEPAGIDDDEDLRQWVLRGFTFAKSLPAK